MKNYAIAMACLLGWAASQGANSAPAGVNIDPDMVGLVRPGMSESEVRAAIGQPARVRHYGNQPGPTWIYCLLDREVAAWHVDFSAEGRVVATQTLMLQSGKDFLMNTVCGFAS